MGKAKDPNKPATPKKEKEPKIIQYLDAFDAHDLANPKGYHASNSSIIKDIFDKIETLAKSGRETFNYTMGNSYLTEEELWVLEGHSFVVREIIASHDNIWYRISWKLGDVFHEYDDDFDDEEEDGEEDDNLDKRFLN
jgi:hypothetical protein